MPPPLNLELIEFCRSRLAHYKCPRSFEFVDSLPKTGTGKILKKDIRQEILAGSGHDASGLHRATAAESKIRRLK